MNRPVIAVVALAACCVHAALAAEERVRVGRAFDADTGTLLYEERHVETLAGGEVIADEVRYVDAGGGAFASKHVDFRRKPDVPEFRFSDERTGHLEALRRLEDGAIEVRFRRALGEEEREARLDMPEAALADAGFDRFIESHWGELLDGKRLVRRFLVPSRLGFVDFRIRSSDENNDPLGVSFTMEIDSALLRLVVPAITVTYDRETRRLLRYDGMSNLRDERGENHVVRIEFEYPQHSARIGND